MTRSTCIVCNKVKKKGDTRSFFHIPKTADKRSLWLKNLQIDESSIKEHHRVCSEHFPNGDRIQPPSLTLGPRFISPKKCYTERGKRAQKRQSLFVPPKRKQSKTISLPGECDTDVDGESQTSRSVTPMSAQAGEQLMSSSDYSIHELPHDDSLNSSVTGEHDETEVLVSKALLARIEFLESQNKKLQSQLTDQKPKLFRI